MGKPLIVHIAGILMDTVSAPVIYRLLFIIAVFLILAGVF
jgi:hypothetical protein